MDRRGQVTLETAVLLLLAINILLYISIPISNVARAAVESVGTTAIAAKAVDAMVQKANMVGISGNGAAGQIRIHGSRDIDRFFCEGNAVKAEFHIFDRTQIELVGTFGVREVLEPYPNPSTKRYSRESDFLLDCGIAGLTNNGTAATICFKNMGGTINIKTC
jgi:hypothetical protein